MSFTLVPATTGADAGSIPVTRSPSNKAAYPKCSLSFYASSAVAEFSPSELVDLLKSCHESNAKLGVTGMLLYKDGNFMQAIEGDEDVVRDLYTKITLDPRHRGMMTLLAESVPKRQFPDWSMGFHDLNAPEARSTPGYSQFLNTPLTDTVFSSDPARCQKLLTTFRRTM